MAAILHAKPLVEFLPKHFCAHFGTARANETIHLKLANDLMLFDNKANGRGDVRTRGNDAAHSGTPLNQQWISY
jgi:hypothetical protein